MARLTPVGREQGTTVLRGLKGASWYVKFFRDPVACMAEAHRRFGPLVGLGDVVRWRRRERLNMLALGSDLNRRVLGDPATFRTTGQTWPGASGSSLRRIRYGLTRMNGPKHRQQRRLIMPLLTKSAVDGYCQDMVAITRHMIQQWPVGQTVDMWQLMRRLSMRLSGQILFGGESPSAVYALSKRLQLLQNQTFSAGVFLFPVKLPGTPYQAMHENAEQIERMFLDMIERRRTCASASADFLEVLVHAREGNDQMTDKDLIGQAAVLFAASYENVGNSLTWTLFLLAQHPRELARLQQELEQTLKGEAPTSEQLDHLPFLDAVIKESMRILAPVPYLVRAVLCPTDLGGIPLQKGDRIFCSPYFTHHMPELFPEPERFLPQRWFNIQPGAYDYLPFGAGPRFCVGYSFAMTEIKIALAMILQRWRLSVVPGARIDRAVKVMMYPRRGMPMTVHPPDGCFHAVPVRGNIHEMVDLNAPDGEVALPARPWITRNAA